MAYNLTNKPVVAVASSALFDLKKSDHVFQTQGENAYRDYQRKHETDTLKQGVAFHSSKDCLL